jgi:multimeric flavodoxin WrbA
MKILLISSSPHREKSSTYLLAAEVMRALTEEGAACEEIHLSDRRVLFCRSCESCHEKLLLCPIDDDVPAILQKMLEADGIVFATPNYINNITGSLKTLLDRSSHFIHCKRLLGKYVAGVATSGSGHAEMVLEYLAYYGNTCGAQSSGGVSAIHAFDEAKKSEAFGLGRKMAADIRAQEPYPEQLAFIEESKKHFARVMKLRKNDWVEEYRYWIEKGWL